VVKNAGDKKAWVAKRNEWADDRRSLNVLLNTIAFGIPHQKYDEALDAWCMVANAPDVDLINPSAEVHPFDDPIPQDKSGWMIVAEVFAKDIRKNRKV